MNYSKPPLGLTPRKRWEEARIRDILDAIKRYMDAGRPVPKPWIRELAELFDVKEGD